MTNFAHEPRFGSVPTTAPAAPKAHRSGGATPEAAAVAWLQTRVGNRALARALRNGRLSGSARTIARVPSALHQPAYASGDQFAVAAMLLHDRESHVFITYKASEEKRAKDMRAFYLESRLSADQHRALDNRIHLVPLDDAVETDTQRRKAALRVVRATAGLNRFRWDDLKYLTDATKYVGAQFSTAMRHKIRSAWGVDAAGEGPAAPETREDAAIRTWLETKGLLTPNPGKKARHRVLVIWSRFSGKRGDAHIEHDTSYQGVRQIIDAAKAEGFSTVIIAGDRWHRDPRLDKTKSDAKKAKFKNIAEQKITSQNIAVLDLTEFWSTRADDPYLQAWLPEGSRTGQFKLYDYLQRHFGEVKHLGFRSGNLEAMALMGFNVRYMEERPHGRNRPPGSTRMEAWHAAEPGKTASGGMAPGYERLEVAQPPTRSGRYWLRNRRGEHEPAWAPGLGTGAKPNFRGMGASGFSTADIRDIRAYLHQGH
jgi:hypothetical protein